MARKERLSVNWIKIEDDASKPTTDGEYVAIIKSPQYGNVKMVLRYDSANDDWYAGVEPYDVCMNSRVTHYLDGLTDPQDGMGSKPDIIRIQEEGDNTGADKET